MTATKSTARVKHCPGCGPRGPAAFSRSRHNNGGLATYCRDCNAARESDRRAATQKAGIEARTAAIRAEKQERGEGDEPISWRVPIVHVQSERGEP